MPKDYDVLDSGVDIPSGWRMFAAILFWVGVVLVAAAAVWFSAQALVQYLAGG